MSRDLDAAEARDLAEAYLASWVPPRDDVWVVTAIDECDWGWVISWVKERRAQGSTAIEDLYAGAGPLLVDRKTRSGGAVWVRASGRVLRRCVASRRTP